MTKSDNVRTVDIEQIFAVKGAVTNMRYFARSKFFRS